MSPCVHVTTRQVCAYCLEPFESRMVPLRLHSRAHGNSEVWLRVGCMRQAFAAAKVPLDADDAAVDVGRPREGRGWAKRP